MRAACHFTALFSLLPLRAAAAMPPFLPMLFFRRRVLQGREKCRCARAAEQR